MITVAASATATTTANCDDTPKTIIKPDPELRKGSFKHTHSKRHL